MQRHPGLRDLSSDHHHALVQAQRLQRGAAADEATRLKSVAEFLQFWHEHAQRHFSEEEQALLPYFARWGELNQEPIHQMLREHALIRRDASLLEAGDYNESTCHDFGAQLEAHVRLEERVIFPLIEAALPEAALAELAGVLHAWQQASSMRRLS